MKNLTLADETLIEVTDDSTISNLVIPFAQYAEVDGLLDSLTIENLTHVELDDAVYVYLTIVSLFVDTTRKQLIVVLRTPTTEEEITTQIKEIQDSIIEIISIIGGE